MKLIIKTLIHMEYGVHELDWNIRYSHIAMIKTLTFLGIWVSVSTCFRSIYLMTWSRNLYKWKPKFFLICHPFL